MQVLRVCYVCFMFCLYVLASIFDHSLTLTPQRPPSPIPFTKANEHSFLHVMICDILHPTHLSALFCCFVCRHVVIVTTALYFSSKISLSRSLALLHSQFSVFFFSCHVHNRCISVNHFVQRIRCHVLLSVVCDGWFLIVGLCYSALLLLFVCVHRRKVLRNG